MAAPAPAATPRAVKGSDREPVAYDRLTTSSPCFDSTALFASVKQGLWPVHRRTGLFKFR